MFDMSYDISFVTDGKKFKLQLLNAVSIEKNVESLSDTCVITLPEAILNIPLDITSKIKRSSEVTVLLGYNGKLREEFKGFVDSITTNDSSLTINCEDSLFLFRSSVSDIELKSTTVSTIAQYLISEVGEPFSLSCDYDIGYEKFVIHQATAVDVLKKLQEETKANIYFSNNTLHIHPPYKERSGKVVYSMQHNVEQSNLEYKRAEDRKVEVTVESTDSSGKKRETKSGTTGGDKINIKVGSMSEADMRKIAESELLRRSSDAYEGSIDSWLIPYCEPTYTAVVKDADYPDKDGQYYVSKVVTEFSSSGGARTITLGIKVG